MKRALKILLIFDYPNPPPKDDYDEVLALDGWKC